MGFNMVGGFLSKHLWDTQLELGFNHAKWATYSNPQKIGKVGKPGKCGKKKTSPSWWHTFNTICLGLEDKSMRRSVDWSNRGLLSDGGFLELKGADQVQTGMFAAESSNIQVKSLQHPYQVLHLVLWRHDLRYLCLAPACPYQVSFVSQFSYQF